MKQGNGYVSYFHFFQTYQYCLVDSASWNVNPNEAPEKLETIITTLPWKTNISPEHWYLEDDISFHNGPFSGDIPSFSEVYKFSYQDFHQWYGIENLILRMSKWTRAPIYPTPWTLGSFWREMRSPRILGPYMVCLPTFRGSLW